MINFDINTKPELMFTTQLFEQAPLFKPILNKPIPYQIVIRPNFELR